MLALMLRQMALHSIQALHQYSIINFVVCRSGAGSDRVGSARSRYNAQDIPPYLKIVTLIGVFLIGNLPLRLDLLRFDTVALLFPEVTRAS